MGVLLSLFLAIACHVQDETGPELFHDARAKIFLKTTPVGGFLRRHRSFEVWVTEDRTSARRVLSGGRLDLARLSAARLPSGRLAATSSWVLAAETSQGDWLEYDLKSAALPDTRLREALVWMASNGTCLPEGRVRAVAALARIRAPETDALLQDVGKLVELTPRERRLLDGAKHAARDGGAR